MSDDALEERLAEHDRKLKQLDRRVEANRQAVDDLLDAVRTLADAANVHIGRRPRRAEV